MMGKQKAQALAREERLTWGELRTMLNGAMVDGKVSAVNAAFTLAQVRDIHLAAMEGRAHDEVPKAWRTDPYTRRDKPSRDFLGVTNILRDFG